MKLATLALLGALVPGTALARPDPYQPQPAPDQNTTEDEDSAPAQPQDQYEVDTFEWSTGRGKLGMLVMGLTPDLRKYFGVPSDRGLLVAQVSPDSPAGRAGIRPGDVVTRIGGTMVERADDILNGLQGNQRSVSIELVRNHRMINVQATLGKAPQQTTPNSNNPV